MQAQFQVETQPNLVSLVHAESLLTSIQCCGRNICFLIKQGRPRRAAFEVQLLWLVGSVEYSSTLASKLCTNKFPDPIFLRDRLWNALEAA